MRLVCFKFLECSNKTHNKCTLVVASIVYTFRFCPGLGVYGRCQISQLSGIFIILNIFLISVYRRQVVSWIVFECSWELFTPRHTCSRYTRTQSTFVLRRTLWCKKSDLIWAQKIDRKFCRGMWFIVNLW